MRGNKQKSIRFVLGTYDDVKQKGHRCTTLFKKTQVMLRASTLMRKNGYVWLRVAYGKHKDSFGQMVEFSNEGVFKKMSELNKALLAFIETDLMESL